VRVLVTGSRDWAERTVVALELDRAFFTLLANERDVREFVVVHGDCPTGADQHAAAWVRAMQNAQPVVPIVPEPHPADWSQGRRAGPERNLQMVQLGADLCLAFIGPCTSPRCHRTRAHGSHGASGCAALAENHGIPTRLHRGWS
jgi:hypothetical protein